MSICAVSGSSSQDSKSPAVSVADRLSSDVSAVDSSSSCLGVAAAVALPLPTEKDDSLLVRPTVAARSVS